MHTHACIHISMHMVEAVRVAAYIIISFSWRRGENLKAKQKTQITQRERKQMRLTVKYSGGQNMAKTVEESYTKR